MSSSFIPKTNASQRTTTPSMASSQYESSSQYRAPPQYRPLPQHQSSVTSRPSTQTTNYFGPIRSPSLRHQPHTFVQSNSQHRASPYTIQSPRTNRRQVVVSDSQHSDCDDDDTAHPGHLVSVKQNTIDLLVDRCDSLEQGIRSLQKTTDKLLKTLLSCSRNEQDLATTKPKTKPNPIVWNNINLLEKPRAALPTTYLCHLVRTMYSADEIKSKVPQLPPKENDNRMDIIRECLVTLYFSHDPSLVNDFMDAKGHTSLYSQERTKRSRDNRRSLGAGNNSNSSNSMNNPENIVDGCHNLDLDSNLNTFDDV